MEENRLKAIRDDLGGISQAKLADMTGIPLYKIKYAETTNAKMSREIAKVMDEKLGYNYLWVLTGVGDKFIQKNQPDEEMPHMMSTWDKELLDACLTLKKIFDDKVHKKAIIENLHAFDLSIDDRKAKEELNKKLQESLKENEGVQNRISNLEKLCADIPDMKNKFESLQSENRALRAENNRLKSTYEAPDGSDGSITAAIEKKAI